MVARLLLRRDLTAFLQSFISIKSLLSSELFNKLSPGLLHATLPNVFPIPDLAVLFLLPVQLMLF